MKPACCIRRWDFSSTWYEPRGVGTGAAGDHAVSPNFVPPLVTLVVSLVVPLVAGFVIVKIHPSESATLPWMMGLIWWMLCGLHVLDMPTGPMACYHCGATDKLWLTFLSLNADSGLLDGQGRFIATWPAVATIGYSLGAKLGLRNADIPFENN